MSDGETFNRKSINHYGKTKEIMSSLTREVI
jgi:hypothetical protein